VEAQFLLNVHTSAHAPTLAVKCLIHFLHVINIRVDLRDQFLYARERPGGTDFLDEIDAKRLFVELPREADQLRPTCDISRRWIGPELDGSGPTPGVDDRLATRRRRRAERGDLCRFAVGKAERGAAVLPRADDPVMRYGLPSSCATISTLRSATRSAPGARNGCPAPRAAAPVKNTRPLQAELAAASRVPPAFAEAEVEAFDERFGCSS